MKIFPVLLIMDFITIAMKIRYKLCGEYFFPDEETLALMADGDIATGNINTCDECREALNR
jgi:hypothetical protein